MERNPSSSRAADRKTLEKSRRNQMKDLYSKLQSLVAHHSSRVFPLSLTHKLMDPDLKKLFRIVEASEIKPLTDQLAEAANYIKKLKMKLEKMKEKRENLMGVENPKARLGQAIEVGFKPPLIDIHEAGYALVVNLITGLDVSSFMFYQVIRMLHEEGLEILNANFSVKNSTVFHTIQAKVGDYAPGWGSATISERLKKLVDGVH